MFPDPVLNGPHKLTRENFTVYRRRMNKIDLTSNEDKQSKTKVEGEQNEKGNNND